MLRDQSAHMLPETPFAFVERNKGAMRLAALNRAAGQSGLTSGTSLADALALVPDLAVHPLDRVADADLLDQIADDCMQFTPMVALDRPDGVILDITGSAHLFGGEPALAESIGQWLKSERVEFRLAYGSSADAAHALARFHRGSVIDEQAAIRALPIAALELDDDADLGLRRAGLRTIGDVLDRPRAVIGARFGTALNYRLERLIGAQSKPINPCCPTPLRSFHRRFAEPVTSKNYALKVLNTLLDQANAVLAAQDQGGRAFEARFCRVDGVMQTLCVETGAPTRNSAAIARLFDERLDGLADPLDPGFGFDSIELTISRTEGLRAQQDDLERPVHSGASLAETLDILGTRHGRKGVLRFSARDTHIPENTQRAVPAADASHAMQWPERKVGEPPMRPLHLFAPPKSIAVIAEVPDGPPRRFRWRGTLHNILRHEGPERISAEWWKSASDPLGDTLLTRDYYRIEDTDGRRFWVFRHGLHSREADHPGWYLHGLFA